MKYILVTLALVSILVLPSCMPDTYTSGEWVSFEASSPVSVFTQADIDYLGVDVSGSDADIANGIRLWQEENMTYGAPEGDTSWDFSDGIRWNYILPGIFPSGQIIYEHVDNGKVYGICFDFAVIYASIADYYGLEYRIMNSLSKPSDTDPGILFTTGMSPQEYERLNVKLQALDINYPFDAVRLVAEETPTHYWAEVKIDGEWVIQDATQISTGNDTKTLFYDTDDYTVTDWLSRDQTMLLDDYSQRLARGERLPEP